MGATGFEPATYR